MSYPNTSDFTLPADDAAWWLIRISNSDGTQSLNVCSTSGRAFVDQVQSMVSVTADGQWGAATSAALVNLLRQSYADATLISGVQAEASLQRVGPLQTRGAIWAIHQYRAIGSAPSAVALADINLPDNAILPVWNTASQAGPGGDISPSCTLVGGAVVAPGASQPDNSQIQVSQMTTDPNAPLSIPQPVISSIATNTLDATIVVGVVIIAGIAAAIAGAFWLAGESQKKTSVMPARAKRPSSARTTQRMVR